LSGFFSKDFIIESMASTEGGVVQFLLFLRFLGMRVYYGLKLMVLIRRNRLFRYRILSFFGFLSLFFRVALILLMVNIHIFIVIGLRYGVGEFKYLVYFIIIIYALISFRKFSGLGYYSVVIRVILKD